MRYHSIRWRLPLSYAAIALLAALALGTVLLLTLRSYYSQVEREFLRSNGQAIGFSLAQLLEDDPSPEVLQPQLDALALLSMTSLRLLDAEGEVVASSDPAGRVVAAVAGTRTAESEFRDPRPLIIIEPGGLVTRTVAVEGRSPVWILQAGEGRFPLPDEGLRRLLPLDGERFRAQAESAAATSYSSQVVQVPIRGSEGQLLGYAELSRGPAYARTVVRNVAWGWSIASVVAVILAAGVGWLISRRLSAPLLALTGVTAAMANGDLAARADVARKDELGTLARSFNQMADRVEGTITTLQRFVSDAAHEIHTPLTALHTNLELVGQDAGARSREHVLQAQAQVDRLEALTTALLDLSRLEASSQVSPAAPVPLHRLVADLGELYASRAEQAEVSFQVSTPAKDVCVPGDEAELRAALTNLLDNALKFTPKGGQISLGLRREGRLATVSVEDTGIGVPAADLPFLFQRFHRGANASAYPGSGLGLAIVRAIVDRHGGQVEAQPGQPGTKFTVSFPLIACP